MQDGINELTFVARLGTATRLRAEKRIATGIPPLIYSGELEERRVDADGRVRRCDIRLNSRSGMKLTSREVMTPENELLKFWCGAALQSATETDEAADQHNR